MKLQKETLIKIIPLIIVDLVVIAGIVVLQWAIFNKFGTSREWYITLVSGVGILAASIVHKYLTIDLKQLCPTKGQYIGAFGFLMGLPFSLIVKSVNIRIKKKTK